MSGQDKQSVYYIARLKSTVDQVGISTCPELFRSRANPNLVASWELVTYVKGGFLRLEDIFGVL